MTVRLIGANPGLRVFADDGEGELLGYASVWRVDWSPYGTGPAVVTWYDQRPRVISPSAELGRWLADEFTRHFPEVRGLPWPEPEVTVAPVTLEQDLSHGVRAVAANVEVEITDPLDRRLVRVDDFDLGGTPYQLSTVLMPCRRGVIRIDGTPLPGAPRLRNLDSPELPVSSSAFLADAEVWCLPAG
ncbi:MAG TPA: hypothetical protein VKZ67_07355 [Natronosporangium sp.]|jgi:hypothetical protein|nr:hypothetical protein [Natronosporangium sp.]